jgi:branched-chain amino acid transport system substrate-binding protein
MIGALALGVGACGGGDGGGDDAQPAGEEAQLDLVVGDVVPLSGDLAPFGPPGRKAADLAVEEINSAIEEAGVDHNVEILHEDSQTNPQAANSAAQSLVGDGASCIAGAWASSSTLPIARGVATREEVLQISPASTSDEITALEDEGFVNRTVTPDSIQGPALADAVEQELGDAEGTVINIGARNDAYGNGLADTFSAAWEEKGGEIGAEVLYDPEQPSYNTEAGQIVEGGPDGLVIIDFPETFAQVGPALARTGDYDPETTFVTDGLASDSLPDDVGADVVEGIRGTRPGTPEEGEAPAAFGELYEQAGGPERQTFDAQNFDAVMLCYLAAVAAGGTEGADMAEQVRSISAPGGTQYTFEELPEAIEALQNGEDIDYQGASGPIDMDDSGDATAGVYELFEYQGGGLEVTDVIPVGAQAEESGGATGSEEESGAGESEDSGSGGESESEQ